MAWNLLAGRELFFQGDVSSTKPYTAAQHLAEMIAILGPGSGDTCQARATDAAFACFGGPFFTESGKFVRERPIPCWRTLADEVPECIPEQGRDKFVAFMRRMLSWLPEERPIAKELKDDPWFAVKV